MSRESVEAGRTVSLPQESTEAGGSAAVPELLAVAGSSVVVPQDPRGASPSAQEQGAGSKRPRFDEAERESGGSPPKHIYRPTALRWVITSSVFPILVRFHRDLCFSSL